MSAPKLSETAHAIHLKRLRRLAMGGTFLVAFALAVQLAQQSELAYHNLLITIPVVFLGAILSGWVLGPSAGSAMALAAVAVLVTLGISQSGSAYTDEPLLFAIPFSAMAVIVVGHCRNWPGKTAIAMAIVLVALAAGVGITEIPIPFIVLHFALLIALPTIPFQGTGEQPVATASSAGTN